MPSSVTSCRFLARLVLLVSTIAPPVSAAEPRRETSPAPKGYLCPHAPAGVTVDGRLDDPAWADAPWTDDFVDIEGDHRPRPQFRTRAKLLWDEDYFYVAAELEEPHVWANLTAHDSVIFQDNDFEIFIDPDGDNHAYFEVEINARNTEWDLFLPIPYRDGGRAVDSWEIPGLKSATHVTGTLNDPSDRDRSWTVELAIPWRALAGHANRPTPPHPGDRWRVNFSRVEWDVTTEGGTYKKVPGKREDNWVWSPQGAVDMHRPERWGYVEFRDRVVRSTPFRPDPTGPARDAAMEVYHAQKAYRATHKAWAGSLAALGLAGASRFAGVGRPVLRLVGDGFEASVVLDARNGEPRRTVTVRQDSRLTVEPSVP